MIRQESQTTLKLRDPSDHPRVYEHQRDLFIYADFPKFPLSLFTILPRK